MLPTFTQSLFLDIDNSFPRWEPSMLVNCSEKVFDYDHRMNRIFVLNGTGHLPIDFQNKLNNIALHDKDKIIYKTPLHVEKALFIFAYVDLAGSPSPAFRQVTCRVLRRCCLPADSNPRRHQCDG